jgi:hypothetical protein
MDSELQYRSYIVRTATKGCDDHGIPKESYVPENNRDIKDGYEAGSQRSPGFNPSLDAEIKSGGFVWVEYSLS